MAQKIFKPRRGRASVLATVNPLLQKGELIIECPDGGVGTGIIKAKIGDGVKRYNSLPYAIKDTIVEEYLITVEKPSGCTTKAQYMAKIVTGQKMKHVLGAIKECLSLTDTTLTELNNKIAGKAASSHTHDDRYYTESEINTKITTLNTAINGKASSTSLGTQVTFSLSGTTLTITPK